MDSQLSTVINEAKIEENLNSSIISDGCSQPSVFDETKVFDKYDAAATLTSLNKNLFPITYIGKNNNINNGSNNSPSETSLYNSFELVSSKAKQPGLRKRTKKIDNILDKATQQLDISIDSMTPCEEKSAWTDSEDNSLDVTLSQKMVDSQENVPYLRKKKKRSYQNMEIVEEKEEENVINFDVSVNEEDEGVDEVDGPFPQDSPKEEESIFGDSEMDTAPPPESSSIGIEDPCIFTLTVNKAGFKKISDCEYLETEQKKYLWTRDNVLIPMYIECGSGNGQKRRIKIKFVRIGPIETLDNALKNREYEVSKCRKHIENETRIPQESFCYIQRDTPNIEWKTKCSIRGDQIETEISEDMQRIDFYLSFSCSENCMEHSEKKGKVMVLVAILEDLEGNQISRACIDIVRIVKLPRRDYKDFLNHGNKNTEINSKKMYNVTNQFQDPMNKSRKRTASNLDFVPKDENVDTPSKNDHQRRLMLGMPVLKPENENNVEMDYDENIEQSAKRSRESIPDVMNFKVMGKERIAAAIEFFSNLEKRARYDATMDQTVKSEPLRAIGRINILTKIDEWLKTMRLKHVTINFQRYAIMNVGDLVANYERDENIFDKLQLPPNESSLIQSTFLNFYYVWLSEQKKH